MEPWIKPPRLEPVGLEPLKLSYVHRFIIKASAYPWPSNLDEDMLSLDSYDKNKAPSTLSKPFRYRSGARLTVLH